MIEANLRVWDRNALAKPRTHEIITRKSRNGEVLETKPYELSAHGAGTLMPFDHALKFLIDPAFIVKNDGGETIKPIPTQETQVAQQLDADQCIARFDELHRDALYQRAKMLAGSEDLKSNTSKEALIAFIKEAAAARKAPSNENAVMGQHLGRDLEAGMDDKELEAILPKSSLPGMVNPKNLDVTA